MAIRLPKQRSGLPDELRNTCCLIIDRLGTYWASSFSSRCWRDATTWPRARVGESRTSLPTSPLNEEKAQQQLVMNQPTPSLLEIKTTRNKKTNQITTGQIENDRLGGDSSSRNPVIHSPARLSAGAMTARCPVTPCPARPSAGGKIGKCPATTCPAIHSPRLSESPCRVNPQGIPPQSPTSNPFEVPFLVTSIASKRERLKPRKTQEKSLIRRICE